MYVPDRGQSAVDHVLRFCETVEGDVGFAAGHHVDVRIRVADQMHVRITHTGHQNSIATVDDSSPATGIITHRRLGYASDRGAVDQRMTGDKGRRDSVEDTNIAKQQTISGWRQGCRIRTLAGQCHLLGTTQHRPDGRGAHIELRQSRPPHEPVDHSLRVTLPICGNADMFALSPCMQW